MKTLCLQLESGAAGDMLAAALLELVPDPQAALSRLRALGIPGVEFSISKSERGGIAGTLFEVRVDGEVEGVHELHEEAHRHIHAHDHGDHHDHVHDHGEHHDHAHDHGEHSDHAHDHAHHCHVGLSEIRERIAALALPDKVREDVRAVYDMIAEAESKAHGRPVDMIHFHEVGSLDALADIAAVCSLVAELAPDRIVATVPNVGGGSVRCAHGLMPVPAPATERLLEGIPWRGDTPDVGELLTPTGAALLRRFATSFGPLPPIVVERTGVGLGHRNVEGRANMVRAMLGQSLATTGATAPCGPNGRVSELRANIDDMTGEALAFACERIRRAGALDVSLAPLLMKKGRPGHLLLALSAPEDADAVAAAILRETSTFGVRRIYCPRYELERSSAVTSAPGGAAVSVKTGVGYGVRKSKPEFDDMAAAADSNGVAIRDVALDALA